MRSRDNGEHTDTSAHWSDKQIPGTGIFDSLPEAKETTAGHELDSADNSATHLNLLGHYYRELDAQSDNRQEMAIDEDLYDHIQWTDEEIAALEERGQVPLVYNVTATTVNWVLGSQRRNPVDYRILPRRKEGLKHAERKSELMKYLSDVSHGPMQYQQAFAEAVKAGLGWMETGTQDEEDGERVYERSESWRNILHDSAARDLDLNDGRYMFRTRWVDADRLKAMFSQRHLTIELSVETMYEARTAYGATTGDEAMDSQEAFHFDAPSAHGQNTYSARKRVRAIECWYRRPVMEHFVRGGDFSGQVVDPWSMGHAEDIAQGRASIVSKIKERMHCAIITEKGMLWNGKSPYRHNRFPFTPVWGYRRARDGMPYGLIRGVRDMQRDLNKRAAKTLWHLSAQRTFVEENAVDDLNKLRSEVGRPDAFVVVKNGARYPDIQSDYTLAAAHSELMQQDIALIERQSGVTDAAKGSSPAGRSGKAIIALQDQGQLTTSQFFDNLRFARHLHGEKFLANIEQFYDEEKTFRITNSRGNPEYVAINDDNPEDDNMITRTKADYVVSEEDYKDTARQANVDRMMELVSVVGQNNPDVLMNVLDLMVEMMDVPKQEELVKRIRQITKQADPDADPNNPDPETQAVNAEKAEAADRAKRADEAQLAGMEATALEKRARAQKIMGEALMNDKNRETAEIKNLKQSVEAAMQIIGMDGVAAVADRIMQDAQIAAQNGMPQPQPQPQPEPIAPPMAPQPTEAVMDAEIVPTGDPQL